MSRVGCCPTIHTCLLLCCISTMYLMHLSITLKMMVWLLFCHVCTLVLFPWGKSRQRYPLDTRPYKFWRKGRLDPMQYHVRQFRKVFDFRAVAEEGLDFEIKNCGIEKGKGESRRRRVSAWLKFHSNLQDISISSSQNKAMQHETHSPSEFNDRKGERDWKGRNPGFWPVHQHTSVNTKWNLVFKREIYKECL